MAIAAGDGIELDVRISRCGTPFVFHDRDLRRLCGIDEQFATLGRSEVETACLAGTDQPIPSFTSALELIGGRVPLLVELKSHRPANRTLCQGVAAALRGYDGPAGVMCFDPGPVRWFAEHAPEILRGLVISDEGKSKIKGLIERPLAIRLGRPDFLAYDIRSLPSAFAARWRRAGGPLLSWTVRTASEARVAEAHADQIIHERWDQA